MGKCVFNRKWLSDAKFSWVKEFKGDKHKTGENWAIPFFIRTPPIEGLFFPGGRGGSFQEKEKSRGGQEKSIGGARKILRGSNRFRRSRFMT